MGQEQGLCAGPKDKRRDKMPADMRLAPKQRAQWDNSDDEIESTASTPTHARSKSVFHVKRVSKRQMIIYRVALTLHKFEKKTT